MLGAACTWGEGGRAMSRGATMEEQGEEGDGGEVPLIIHMVWVGSPLPTRHRLGPTSFARLNPGVVWISSGVS